MCQPGARVQAWVGSTWYNGTVLEARDNGCLLTWDGYSSSSDSVVPYADLRGGAPPAPSTAAPTGPMPDGRYICRKLVAGGGLRDVAMLTVSNGRPYLSGLPAGWTVESIGLANGDGEVLIRVFYRSEGYRDEMDCTLN